MNVKWIWGAAMTAAIGTTTPVYAQNTSSSARSADQREITVTGCLQGSNPTSVGTSGSGGSGSAATTRSAEPDKGPFFLVNARIGGAPGGGSGAISAAPPGSGGTDSSVRAGSSSPSPRLTGAIDANGEPDKSDSQRFALRGDHPELPRRVGQEVEISGNLVAASAAAPSGTASSTGAGATAQQIEVKTVRMLASVCVTR